MHQRQGLRNALGAFGLGHAPHLQPKADVVEHGHVGKQGVTLKHDTETTRIGFGLGDVLTRQQNLAAADLGKAGNHL